jgi:hypothetical protein
MDHSPVALAWWLCQLDSRLLHSPGRHIAIGHTKDQPLGTARWQLPLMVQVAD